MLIAELKHDELTEAEKKQFYLNYGLIGYFLVDTKSLNITGLAKCIKRNKSFLLHPRYLNFSNLAKYSNVLISSTDKICKIFENQSDTIQFKVNNGPTGTLQLKNLYNSGLKKSIIQRKVSNTFSNVLSKQINFLSKHGDVVVNTNFLSIGNKVLIFDYAKNVNQKILEFDLQNNHEDTALTFEEPQVIKSTDNKNNYEFDETELVSLYEVGNSKYVKCSKSIPPYLSTGKIYEIFSRNRIIDDEGFSYTSKHKLFFKMKSKDTEVKSKKFSDFESSFQQYLTNP